MIAEYFLDGNLKNPFIIGEFQAHHYFEFKPDIEEF